MEAKLEKSTFFSVNDTRAKLLTIKSTMDLNQLPSIVNPVTVSDSKEFGIFCCASGPLSDTVNIPRTGYAPGENIVVSGEIENTSDREMSSHEVNILRHMVYKSDWGKRKIVETKIKADVQLFFYHLLL